jgi:tRNA A-37 threonylcarbamoyl transferase component Bud32
MKNKDMDTLKTAVEKLISENKNRRTFSFDYNGEKLWIKQPELGEVNIWHRLSFLLSKVLKNNFFKPTIVTDPLASLAYEANKIAFLHQNHIHVPELIMSNRHYLVLKDSGIPLSSLLNSDEIILDEKLDICKQLSISLADMHNRGFYHSRPALRDITYKEGKIYFMDFEENLEESLTTEEAILRDGLIFVHALYRKLHSPELIITALESYHRSLRPDLWDRLMDEGRSYTITFYLLTKLRKFLGKDGIAIYQTLHYFRQF